MRLITSKQVGVKFIACPSPVIIDKREAWGESASNLQQAPNGAFLKMQDDLTVSHLVQPNADFTAPVGWVIGSAPGLYDKAPIFVTDEVLAIGSKVKLDTLDGPIEYDVKEPAMICYNVGADGAANFADGWVQKLADLQKNYVL